MNSSRCLLLSCALAAALPADCQDAGSLLELTLAEAVERALANNLDIAVERLGPEARRSGVEEASAAFDTRLTSALHRASRVETPTSLLVGGDRVSTRSLGLSFGATKALHSGGDVALSLLGSHVTSNSVFATFSPADDLRLSLSVRQPLLRNRNIDEARVALKVARKNQEISEAEFRQRLLNTLADVRQLYWDLALAAETLKVEQQALALAERLIAVGQARFATGTSGQLDVVAAEAERARRQEALIVAEVALAKREDQLRRAIFQSNDEATWGLRIVAKDPLRAEPVSLDVESAVREALAGRADVVAARRELERASLGLEQAANDTRPSLDLVASYTLAGLGGTQILRAPLGGPIVQEIPGQFGDALKQVARADFPSWNVGLSVSRWASGRRSRAAQAHGQLDVERARLRLKRLEMEVVAQLRDAGRDVEASWRRVAASRASAQLQQKQLDVEQARFEAGLSTSNDVAQSQRDLARARVGELEVTAALLKSAARFDLLRQAGIDEEGRISLR